jgi:hypothetical protein
VVKKLRTPKSPVRIHPRKLDEFWLASTMCGKLRLWNVNDGSGKIIKVSQDPMTVDYFSASPYTAPDVLFRTTSRFGYWINNRLHEHEYGLLAVPNHEILLEKLDGHKLLISSRKFRNKISLIGLVSSHFQIRKLQYPLNIVYFHELVTSTFPF